MDSINIDDIKRLNVKPGEVLVFHHNERLRPDVHTAIREQLAALLPGVSVIVLDSGLKLAATLSADDGNVLKERVRAIEAGRMTREEARASLNP